MALGVEAAEIMEHFQWLAQEESRHLGPDKPAVLNDEIGDVIIDLTELAAMPGIDLLEAAWEKPAKNTEKHPAEIVRSKGLKHAEYKRD